MKAADQAISSQDLLGTNRRSSRPGRTQAGRTDVKVYNFNYIDDMNPLIVTKGLSPKEHDRVIEAVNRILDKEGTREHLSWDPEKYTRVDFGRKPKSQCKSLGLTISSDLNFKLHVRDRVHKARGAIAILSRISNSNSGISPKAARQLYTGCIRPMLTYGAEVWYQEGSNLARELDSVQREALRKVTGAYRGSSARKVELIANVEPMELYLGHLQGAWAARTLRSADTGIREFLEAEPPTPYQKWNQGRVPRPPLDSAICTAFHASGIPSEAELSYGTPRDHRTFRITDLTIFLPDQEESKVRELWSPHLDSLRDRGWRMAYTDGSGAEGARASGVYSEGVSGTPTRGYGSHLGTGGATTVADAERLAIALALEQEHPAQPLAILSDSMAAISTLRNLAKGNPPRSGIEGRMKQALEGEREVGVAWVRSHIGITGNEIADRLAAFEITRGQGSHQDLATYEGLREKGRREREEQRTDPGYGNHRTEWGKHALASYTWTRTDRGPQKSWLHHVGKAEDPECSCGHPLQNGEHLVFECPDLEASRARNLPPDTRTWEDLDAPHWVVTEAGGPGREQKKEEGTEIFFQDLYWHLTGGAGEGAQ